MLKSIVDNSPFVITIMNKNGEVIYINPAVDRVHGLGKNFIERKNYLQNIHPQDIPQLRKMFNTTLKSTQKVNFGIFRVRYKDGTYHTIRASGRNIMDSSGNVVNIAYSTDISNQVKAEEALKESEERYRMLADSAQDMIFMINRDWLVEYVNDSAAVQFHKKPKAIIGKPLKDLFPSYILKRQRISLEKAFKTGKPFYIANDTKFPSGQKLLDTWLVPIKDESGKVKSVYGVSRDVTRFRLAELELERRTEESEEAKLRAQIYFDFLAHDIANLVSPVLTYSDALLQTDIKDAFIRDHLTKIKNQSQRTAKFIMDIRMLVEAEKTPLESSGRFDIGRFFMDMAEITRAKFPDKCDISLSYPKGEKMEALGGIHIRNAFMIGFSAAMSSPSEECINIDVNISSVKRSSRPFWRVSMKMKGRPLDPAWIEKTITPFDPARKSKGRSIESISISAAILKHFGGELRDESIDAKDPSKGHVVIIELPKAGSWHTTSNT